jgi:magnesium-transporting ATPase (P-type)
MSSALLENISTEIQSSGIQNNCGLTSAEAQERLKIHGSNAILSEAGKHPLKILASQFINPMVYLLLVAAGHRVFKRYWMNVNP